MLRAIEIKVCVICNLKSCLKCYVCDKVYCSLKCHVQVGKISLFLAFFEFKCLQDKENHNLEVEVEVEKSTNPAVSQLVTQTLQNKSNVVETCQNDSKGALERSTTNPFVLMMCESEKEKFLEDFDLPCKMSSQALDETFSFESNSLPPDAGSTPISQGGDSAIDLSLREMSSSRKFHEHSKLDESSIDVSYHLICVSSIEEESDNSVVYWVLPLGLKSSFEAYKKSLNSAYTDDDLPLIPLADLHKFKTHMVIAKVSGEWSRSKIIKINHELVTVQNLDTGIRETVDMSREVIKIPKERELLKPSFAFKVIFENMDTQNEIKIDDVLKIRITIESQYGINLAEIEKSDDEPLKKLSESKVEPEKDEKRLTIDELQLKSLTPGKKVRLMYCDAGKMKEGKLHLGEATKECIDFFNNLEDDIAIYIKYACNESFKGYKPE